MMRRRVLEMIPGGLIWTTFVLAVVFSFVAPLAAIVFIIVFDLYWLFRIVYFVFSLLSSWRRFRRDSNVPWFNELQKLDGYELYTHLIFLPTYKEDTEVIRQTLACLTASSFPTVQMMVVLAGEERDRENFLRTAEELRSEFGARFAKFFVTVHPKDLPDEIPGKGSNLHFAGNEVKKEIDALGIPYERIIVSSFDVDTCVPREYFSYLTYLYLTEPDPTRASYQPVALFNNNMWDAPAPIRVASFGTTFWLLNELGRPDSLMTFSSHSMSFKMLVDVGFWQKDVVSEDSRIFLQGLVRYHGDYRVVPMYMGVSVDAVVGKNYWDSLVALYKQQRRWAYGVENFPYMVEKFSADREMPWRTKLRFLFFHVEGMFTWATAPVLIFILGRLPLYVANTESLDSLIHSAPFTLRWIMRLAMVGVLVSAGLSFWLLPHPPARRSRFGYVIMVLQWLLLPVTFVVFGAFPAIDAQTRLMLGKYLGFNVTAKKRV